jgi:hypothetical protein
VATERDGGITKLVVGVMVGGHHGMLPGPWGKLLSERDASRGTDKGDLRVEEESLGFMRRQGGGNVGVWLQERRGGVREEGEGRAEREQLEQTGFV